MLDKRQSQDAQHSFCPPPSVICVWRPYLKQDIRAIEKVQTRATKMVPELKYLNNTEILRKLGLTILKARKQRGYFKFVNNASHISWYHPNSLTSSLTQADQRVDQRPQPKMPTHKELSNQVELFHQQNRQPLNALPPEVISA